MCPLIRAAKDILINISFTKNSRYENCIEFNNILNDVKKFEICGLLIINKKLTYGKNFYTACIAY